MLTRQQKINRQTLFEFLLAFGIYTIVTVAAYSYGPHLPHSTLRGIVLLSPILPFGFMVIVVLRTYFRSDEYQRMQTLQNWSLTAAVTFTFCFCYGLLENLGWNPLPLWVVCPLMGVFCGFIQAVRTWGNHAE